MCGKNLFQNDTGLRLEGKTLRVAFVVSDGKEGRPVRDEAFLYEWEYEDYHLIDEVFCLMRR